jgi:hypothetical protein
MTSIYDAQVLGARQISAPIEAEMSAGLPGYFSTATAPPTVSQFTGPIDTKSFRPL